MFKVLSENSLHPQIHTWDRFDVFRVAELTQGRPLYTVAMAIFEALGLLVSRLNSTEAGREHPSVPSAVNLCLALAAFFKVLTWCPV